MNTTYETAKAARNALRNTMDATAAKALEAAGNGDLETARKMNWKLEKWGGRMDHLEAEVARLFKEKFGPVYGF